MAVSLGFPFSAARSPGHAARWGKIGLLRSGDIPGASSHDSMMASIISCPLADDFAWNNKAARPAMIGVAIEVPTTWRTLPREMHERMSTPGATRSGTIRVFGGARTWEEEKSATLFFSSQAPTDKTSAKSPGVVPMFGPSLPTGHTMRVHA